MKKELENKKGIKIQEVLTGEQVLAMLTSALMKLNLKILM